MDRHFPRAYVQDRIGRVGRDGCLWAMFECVMVWKWMGSGYESGYGCESGYERDGGYGAVVLVGVRVGVLGEVDEEYVEGQTMEIVPGAME